MEKQLHCHSWFSSLLISPKMTLKGLNTLTPPLAACAFTVQRCTCSSKHLCCSDCSETRREADWALYSQLVPGGGATWVLPSPFALCLPYASYCPNWEFRGCVVMQCCSLGEEEEEGGTRLTPGNCFSIWKRKLLAWSFRSSDGQDGAQTAVLWVPFPVKSKLRLPVAVMLRYTRG